MICVEKLLILSLIAGTEQKAAPMLLVERIKMFNQSQRKVVGSGVGFLKGISLSMKKMDYSDNGK